MRIEIRESPFDPLDELARHQAGRVYLVGRHGALASFIGTMRDFNDGVPVQAMTLEHYPGMTERELGLIVDEARARWELLDVLVLHRIGELRPGNPIVLVAVWSAHRAAAFDACRHLVEALKTRAPLWKKERRGRDTCWVESNTPGTVSDGTVGRR